MNHQLVMPIVIPMLGGTLSLFAEHRRFTIVQQRIVAWIAMTCVLISVISIYVETLENPLQYYLMGHWPAQLGIVISNDRLSSVMLLTTDILAVASLLHASSGWDKSAAHFHALFQFQLMGMHGVFLTSDIFNLFVFFEVMLIASFGLILSGSSQLRVALHYMLLNIVSSTIFLLAIGLVYALFGALSFQQLTHDVNTMSQQDIPLAKTIFGILLCVFCAKAAIFPLHIWLPNVYTRIPLCVGIIFVIMTKVGLYAMLRISMMWFHFNALSEFAHSTLLWLGIITLIFSAIGCLAATQIRNLAAWLTIVSSATLCIAFSQSNTASITAGIYYLPYSTFTVAALFIISGMIPREQQTHAIGKMQECASPSKFTGCLFFITAVMIIGLPPFAGFFSKILLLQSIDDRYIVSVWTTILSSSILVMLSFLRVGIRTFWLPQSQHTEGKKFPHQSFTHSLHSTERYALMLLLSCGLAITILSQQNLQKSEEAAQQVYSMRLLDFH